MTTAATPGADATTMRLLVLTNAYPPHELGGYELICRDHVRWMRAHGSEVTVVTTTNGMRPTEAASTKGEDGETVIRVLDLHWRDFDHRPPRGPRMVTRERAQRKALSSIIAMQRPDAVLAWGMAGVSKSVLAVVHSHGLPIVAVIEEHWPIWDIRSDAWLALWSSEPGSIKRRLQSSVQRLAERIIAPVDIDPALRAIRPVYCSDYMRGAVEDAVPEWRDRGRVAHNGVDPDLVERGAFSRGALSNPLRLVYAGRIERRKGVHTAIEALGLLLRRGSAATLTIAGWPDRKYADEARRLAADIGVAGHVTWLAPVGHDRVVDLLNDHDIMVFPTIWAEPFGLAALEAMACGCLVVATGSGGSGEFLRHRQTAMLFPAEDADALAAAVEELASKYDLASSLRHAARACALDHSFEAFATSIDSAVRESLWENARMSLVTGQSLSG